MISPTLLIAGVSAVASGAAGFALAWQLQAGNISEINLGAANDRIASQRVARQTIERATSAVITAQNGAAVRAPVLRRGADAAANAGNGLRVTSDTAVRSAADNADACRAIVNAYAEIQRESSDFIREVAIVADQCISDVQTLTEAYPK